MYAIGIFFIAVWSLYTLGEVRESEAIMKAAFVVSYFAMGLAGLFVQRRLEGVLKTFVQIFAAACAFIGAGYFAETLGVAESATQIIHNPGRLLTIVASFVVLVFLYRLNPASGPKYLLASLGLGLLAGGVVHFLVGPGSQPNPALYWLFLVFTANAVFLASFFLFSALWTWGGVWSSYFLFPFVVIALSFGVFCFIAATNLAGLSVVGDIVNLVGHTIFFIALVSLYAAQEQPSGSKAG